MSEVTLQIGEKLAEYLNEKGFAEIFVRTTKGKCMEIAKCLIKQNPDKAEEIAQVAERVMKQFAVNKDQMDNFKADLLKQINPQEVRREIAKMSRCQAKDSKALREMSADIKNIFSDTGMLKGLSWLNSALSLCNLGATIGSSIIIGKKLNEVNVKLETIGREIKTVEKKLEHVETGIRRVEDKVDALGEQMVEVNQRLMRLEDKQEHTMHALFVSSVKDPCRKLISTYIRLTERIRKGDKISWDELTEYISEFHDRIESILEVKIDYPNWKSDMLSLLLDLLPAMTDMIVYFHTNYYDPQSVKSPMCERWMDIYDKLSNELFANELRNYLFTEMKLHNFEVQKQVDGVLMTVLGYKFRILQLLDDIAGCKSVDKYVEYEEYSNETTFRMVKKLMSEIKISLGSENEEILLDKPKEMHMYAEIL